MSQQDPGSQPHWNGSDAWAAFGYPIAGIAFYGGLGWLLDRWLGTSFLVPIGIFVGLGFAVYLIFKRFGYKEPPTNSDT